MESKYVIFSCIVGALMCGLGSSDLAQDRQECADKLVGLSTCLTYVGGTAKSPTPDCCTGLKEVVDKSKKCLCILIKDRDDPNLGLKINLTLALNLPSACHSPTNISDCVSLLHLPPNSADAKVFEDFSNRLKGNSTSTTPTPGSSASASGSKGSTAADEKNKGERGQKWLGVQVGWALLITLGVSHFYLITV